MKDFKDLVKELEVENICLGSDAQERLMDSDGTEEFSIAENDGFQTVIVMDPGVFIPELKICAMNAMVCNNDNGMIDWDGTALFNVTPEGFTYAYIEQDPLLITLHNSLGKDASKMKAFVLKGVADKIISQSSKKAGYRKESVILGNPIEKEIESEM